MNTDTLVHGLGKFAANWRQTFRLSRPNVVRLLRIALLLALLILAAYLRTANVVHNPGWYTDEGTHLDIARHLREGRVRYLAITGSTLLFAKLPLFDLLVALMWSAVGSGMLALRLLSAMLGTLSCALLYGGIRRNGGDQNFALVAAALLAVYPRAVLYHRFGFSYNLLSPLLLIYLFSVHHFWVANSQRALLLAALALGLGMITDLMMIMLLPILLAVLAVRRPRVWMWSLVLAALPLTSYVVWQLVTAPAAFRFDLHYTVTRLDAGSLAAQVGRLVDNVTNISREDLWWPLGIVGLLSLRPRSLRFVALAGMLLPFLLLGRTVALYSLSYYYLIPLLPLVALGIAALVCGALRYFYRYACSLGDALTAGIGDTAFVSQRALHGIFRVVAGLALFMMAVPLGVLLQRQIHATSKGLPTTIDSFLVNAQAARTAASLINDYTNEADVVIASPAIAWQIDADVADFQMVAAAGGHSTPHLPADLPASRFAFLPSYADSRLVVVDPLWRNWAAVHVPGVSTMLTQLAQWHLLFAEQGVEVYANPDLTTNKPPTRADQR